jgi:hypothetical protein
VLPQELADLVAVEVSLFKEPEYGQIQHCDPLYRFDIAPYKHWSRRRRMGLGIDACVRIDSRHGE